MYCKRAPNIFQYWIICGEKQRNIVPCCTMLLSQSPLFKYRAKSWSHKLQEAVSWTPTRAAVGFQLVDDRQLHSLEGACSKNCIFRGNAYDSWTWALLFLLKLKAKTVGCVWTLSGRKRVEYILQNLYIQGKCKHRAAMFLPSYCTTSWTVLMFLVKWEKLVPLSNKSLHYIKI